MTRGLNRYTHTAAIALLAGMNAAYAADAPKAPADTVEEVVVTATKRTTNLEKTPIAVTALSENQLREEHVNNIEDVVHLVPSFQATSEGDHDVITMTLRGIGNDSAKTEYADPEVATYINGIYAPRAEGATALLFDVDDIEVLRGPQGTLWGRNSTVGAVNIQTAKPTLDEFYGNVEASIGDYSQYGERGALNIPIDDTLGFRLAFVHEQHDGYVSYQTLPVPSIASQQAALAAFNTAHGTNLPFIPLNPNLYQGGNAPRYDAQDQTAARFSALWKPMSNLTWNLSFEFFKDNGTPDMNLLQSPRPGTSLWSALIDTAPYINRDSYNLRSRIDYDINDYLGLTYIAGYSWFNGSSDFDQDGGATLPTCYTCGGSDQEDRTNFSHYFNFSHEVQLKSLGSHTVDWILGAYYGHEDNSIRFDINILNGTNQGTMNWGGSFVQPAETVNTAATFAQATYNVTPELHLTGGVRYTHDERANNGGLGIGFANGTGPISPGENAIDIGWKPYSFNTGTGNWGRATWLGRADYNITDDILGYVSISTGYKSGGVQDGGFTYNPETLTNYEIGAKAKLFGNRATLNSAFYYEDFSDFQFSAPVTNPDGTHVLRTSNAAGATVYGFETELAAKITPNDTVGASMALEHTKLGFLIAGSNDYSLPACTVPGISTCLNVTGHELPHAPAASFQLAYEHSFDLPNGGAIVPRVSTHIETSSWLSVFNLGSGDKQDAYTRTDLSLRYESPSSHPWSIEAFVRNVEDGNIKTNAQNAFGAWQAEYLPPRTFGIDVKASF